MVKRGGIAISAAVFLLGAGSAAARLRTFVLVGGGYASAGGVEGSGQFRVVVKEPAYLIPRGQSPCHAFAAGAFATGPYAYNHPTFTWPGFGTLPGRGNGVSGFPLGFYYHGPGTYRLSTSTHTFGSSTGYGSNEPFQITDPQGVVIGPGNSAPLARYSITIKRDGDGEVRESAPSSYQASWDCIDSKPEPAGRVTLGETTFEFYDAILNVEPNPVAGAGATTIRQFSLQKVQDSTTPKLLRLYRDGTVFPKATIELFREGTRKVILTYTLQSASIDTLDFEPGGLEPSDAVGIGAVRVRAR